MISFAILGIFIVVLFCILVRAKGTLQCPPNEVMIIFRRGKWIVDPKTGHVNVHYRIRRGKEGSAFIWPYFEDYYFLNLGPHEFRVEFPFSSHPVDGDPLRLFADACVRVEEDVVSIKKAVDLTIHWGPAEAQEFLRSLLEKHLFTAVSSWSSAEIRRDPYGFTRLLETQSRSDMKEYGFELLSFKISDLRKSEAVTEEPGIEG